ncbi:MAG: NTP transferase domain-containing protein [Candidatus Onthomonas sp.]
MTQLILLAAGLSRRFGGNKLLADWHGKPLYTYSLLALAALTARRPDCRLTVVTRYEEIQSHALALGAQVRWNGHSEDGISSSLRLGLESAPDADFYLCSVADQPDLTTDTAEAFLNAFLASGKPLGCVTHQGQPGNPAIFHRQYWDELMALQGDTGGRRVLERHQAERFLWPGPALPDLDTRPDFQRDK